MLTLATTPSDLGTLTVTVEAFAVDAGGARSSLGTGIATITMQDPNTTPPPSGDGDDIHLQFTNIQNSPTRPISIGPRVWTAKDTGLIYGTVPTDAKSTVSNFRAPTTSGTLCC